MKHLGTLLTILLFLAALGAFLALAEGVPPAPSDETVTTAALVEDGVLYVASYENRGRAGHLRAFTLSGNRKTRLWDAAELVPVPGAALPPAIAPDLAALLPPFSDTSGERLLFTNLEAAQGFRLVSFEAGAAHALRPLLGVANVAEAAALINAVRGRLDTSAADPAGSGDRPDRLGAISRSSPALVGGSPVAGAAANRDQVVYIGAEDGLLHAIVAGRKTDTGYDHTAAGCGRELWGYLPGSLLPYLKEQPLAVHVDGAPAVSDLFIDSDGDGRREWRTILVGTASVQPLNRGVAFALDVTAPEAPRLLWETSLVEVAAGRSRGAALGCPGGWSTVEPRVFLTCGTAGRIDPQGAPDPRTGSYGVLACALDLADGRLLWRFAAPYSGVAASLTEPPSIPSLMTAAGDGVDGVVFGDLAGRLWVLDPQTGAPRSGGPVWQTPGGAEEPIGGGLAVRNRLVLLGTGGVDTAATDRTYAVYAVEILGTSARLLWSQPLEPGERMWGAPVLDRFGRSYLGLGGGGEADNGRLLVVAADGTLAGSAVLAGAPAAGPVVVSGAVVTVSRTGQVEQRGDLPQTPVAGPPDPGRVRVLSWRLR